TPKRAGKTTTKCPNQTPPGLGPVVVDPRGGVTIAIHAKPGSKQNIVTDMRAEAVRW
uniref:Uncharacterized protein n=1 Tax=Canis lupus familiaris TaxID=9615 RepID=A0A8I3MYZ2_CANLF